MSKKLSVFQDELPDYSENLLTRKEKIDLLRAEIERHNGLYYDEARPEISDSEYDSLFLELVRLEKRFPEFSSEDSPTRRLGKAHLQGFEQVCHTVPMLSIENTSSEVGLVSFFRRTVKALREAGHESPVFCVEPKIDGVAVSVRYENGVLTRVVTRGDGERGDDITRHMLMMRAIPSLLEKDFPSVLDIRGEIFINTEDFVFLNNERDLRGLPAFSNSRNATAGALRQLQTRYSAMRPLRFFAHGIGHVPKGEMTDFQGFARLMDKLGIARNGPLLVANSQEEMLENVQEIKKMRYSFGYAIDGIVIKLCDFSQREFLGTTYRAPRWCFALKFPNLQKTTKLLDITVQVGRTGVLTPVAELEQVVISRTKIARANLHNQEEIVRKDIRIGDTVLIEKFSDIIPLIVKVMPEFRTENSKPFNLHEFVGGRCPSCNHKIVQKEGSVFWSCANFSCPAQLSQRLALFTSRKGLGIESIGGVISQALVAKGFVHNPLDLFELDFFDLSGLHLGSFDTNDHRRVGSKRASKALFALEKAKNLPLERWIVALGISDIGESVARELARLHCDFFELVNSPIIERLCRHNLDRESPEMLGFFQKYRISEELKPSCARSLYQFFRSPNGKHVVKKLKKLNINPKSHTYQFSLLQSDSENLLKSSFDRIEGINSQLPQTESVGKLEGLGLAVTGIFSEPRAKIESLIRENTGRIMASVTKHTSYLVSGKSSGSKRREAERLGIPILSELEFYKLIGKTPPQSIEIMETFQLF